MSMFDPHERDLVKCEDMRIQAERLSAILQVTSRPQDDRYRMEIHSERTNSS